ncbi:Na+/H+ antiporter NhaC [Microbulbifer flavimaris]|uniref:Na+/H+ antiporter NhaC n=1 Tax=Microbulbifer flavimaris TaxID=1781068 RepID=A0ABX4I347_9GAMM|nr:MULTISPECIES: Na+/H+ antiporter NhaC [Microbulbifer]KUJ84511.1 sodium:proton antiporter [Microbulbifer sp. ZGT114]PCO06598.1 Na+/H+ antiporter NhaC [Microbulbifer flavimaris]
MDQPKEHPLSALDAVLLGAVLLLVLGGAIGLFGSNSLAGATQVAMMMTGFLAALVGLKNGIGWEEIEAAIVKSTARTAGPNLIFLSIGALIGAMMLSGAVPTLLFVGMKLLSPQWFYPTCCLICAIVSICIGSSWTTAATIGVAMVGVAYGFSLSPAITAGAVVSGAYFGDKMSPLSETTNLAPAIAGSNLFSHIRNMSWVSVPSFGLALVVFFLISVTSSTDDSQHNHVTAFLQALEGSYTIAWYNLIPVVLLLALAIKKAPAYLAITGATIVAMVLALLTQMPVVKQFIGLRELEGATALGQAIWITLYDGFAIQTGNEQVDSLLSRGGMISMVNMVWLVLASMMMTGVLERIGFINLLMRALSRLISSTGSLIATTMGTSLGVNVLTGDQYLSIVLPGQMWKAEYKKRGLASVNLSRSLEDGGTITSPLIPWNACGVYMANTLQVTTLAYLPFCFFNLINPIVALAYGFLNIRIVRISGEEMNQLEGQSGGDTRESSEGKPAIAS